MTGEPIDDFVRLDAIQPATLAPVGGWLSLWQSQHTIAALAMLPGVFAINSLIAGWQAGPVLITLIAMISLVQVPVAASYLPQQSGHGRLHTCAAIPVATALAASVLLSEAGSEPVFGALALGLAVVGAALRFFSTTCEA